MRYPKVPIEAYSIHHVRLFELFARNNNSISLDLRQECAYQGIPYNYLTIKAFNEMRLNGFIQVREGAYHLFPQEWIEMREDVHAALMREPNWPILLRLWYLYPFGDRPSTDLARQLGVSARSMKKYMAQMRAII